MKKAVILIYMCALVLSSTAWGATISVFTDRSSWEAAVHGSYLEEQFSGPSLLTGLSVSRGALYYGGGYYLDSMAYHDSLSQTESAVWSYGPGFYGFGGTWNLDPYGTNGGRGLLLTALFDGGSQVVGQISNNVVNDFFGFYSSDQLLKGVKVELGNQLGSGEEYRLDNLVLSGAPPAPNVVPEPSTIVLCGIGIAGVALMRMRRPR